MTQIIPESTIILNQYNISSLSTELKVVKMPLN